jgi:IS1 family transposase
VQPVGVYGKRSPNTTKERPVTATSGRLIQGVIPDEQHEAAGKEEGETSRVERWINTLRINTLRQRLSRFVRKTLSFSKSHYYMHHCCLKLFIYRYDLERKAVILG